MSTENRQPLPFHLKGPRRSSKVGHRHSTPVLFYYRESPQDKNGVRILNLLSFTGT